MRTVWLPAQAVNACYAPFLRCEKRYQIFFGGSSSGKSCFLAMRCMLDALSGRNTLVVRHVGRTLRASCWNEILKSISRCGLTDRFSVSKTEMLLTAKDNGAQILFAGLDDVEKVKSITPGRGVLTDVWIEEATEIAYTDFKQLDKRLRGISRHAKRLTLSFNPVYRTHWLYREFFGVWEDGKSFAESKDVSILKTTYLDNRFLTDDDRRALENERDPYFREVYTLGNWGVLGDVIFRSFRVEDLSLMRKSADKPLFGLDFGFSGDPCGAVMACCDRARHRVYVLRELCERGLTNRMLAERLKSFAGQGYVVCDSAEPKSIAELRSLGIRALPARKGPDSVVHGIQWLQGHEIIVDPECANLRRELSLYQWQKDADGSSINRPADRDNHLIDALRYALEDEMNARRAEAVARPAWI